MAVCELDLGKCRYHVASRGSCNVDSKAKANSTLERHRNAHMYVAFKSASSMTKSRRSCIIYRCYINILHLHDCRSVLLFSGILPSFCFWYRKKTVQIRWIINNFQHINHQIKKNHRNIISILFRKGNTGNGCWFYELLNRSQRAMSPMIVLLPLEARCVYLLK